MLDMQEYLSETETLARTGKYSEALERFLWFHGHAVEHDQHINAVRLSFALSYWIQLADRYPPARTAMIEVRDRTAKILLRETQPPDKFHDVAALNRYLGDDDQTVALFEQLANANPAVARLYWIFAKDVVIAAGRYDLAERYMGQITQEFDRLKESYLGLMQYLVDLDDPELAADLKQIEEGHFVDSVVQLIQVAIAIDKRDAAQTVQTQAMSLINDPKLHAVMDRG